MKTILFSVFMISFTSCSNPQNFDINAASEAQLQNITYNNKVDLLWVVDTSTSMGAHQQNLSNQFGSFIDVLNAKKIDYHIAIITMDMSASGEKGRFVGTPSVIASANPNAKTLFQKNIKIGETGSSVERGFEAMKMALSPARLASENKDFLRADAQLAVIFVSNEEDRSSGQPQDYAAFLDTLKPINTDEEPPKWSANFIGITVPNGVCHTRGDIAYPGDRYMDLARLSEGQIAEICDNDLSNALSNIRKRIVERLVEFYLSQKPLIESIVVRVNGKIIPKDATNGWTYEEVGFVIRFHGSSVPAADAVVNIDYKPATD